MIMVPLPVLDMPFTLFEVAEVALLSQIDCTIDTFICFRIFIHIVKHILFELSLLEYFEYHFVYEAYHHVSLSFCGLSISNLKSLPM